MIPLIKNFIPSNQNLLKIGLGSSLALIVADQVKKYFFTNHISTNPKSKKGDEEIFNANIVNGMVDKLNSKQPNGIKFTNVNSEIVKGGESTALSLKFISNYFKIEKRISFLNFIKKFFITQTEFIISNLGNLEAFKESPKMKAKEAAFNQITVLNKDDSDTDHAKNKIQAVANYNSFKVGYCSEELEIKDSNVAKLDEQLSLLPEGAFLLRIIKPSNNEKLEEKGHSLVYIKEKGVNLLYNPDKGIKDISANPLHLMGATLLQNHSQHAINKARFYQISTN